MNLKKVTGDLMLTIDQISHLSGVRKSTLRYWEKAFENFLKPDRTNSNRREYSLDDLDRVQAIKQLLEQEHLTSHGVRLRLVELFPLPKEGERRRRGESGDVKRSPAL